MFALNTVVLLLHTLGILAKDEADSTPSVVGRCATDAFNRPQIGRGVTILSMHAQQQHNFTSIKGGPLQQSLKGLNFCQVQIYLTHETPNDIDLGRSDAKDKVLVEIWLPLNLEDWNGRLQVTGGAGFATGMFGAHLGAAVKNGWAAVSTDGGHDADLAKLADASWLVPDGEKSTTSHSNVRQRQIKWNLLHNFASRSHVDQILIGKSITKQYFGMQPHHSYWNGCSTGGRQGYSIAQKYPELLDGILAVAPAISFINLLMGELWPLVVMNKAKTYLSNCELDYFRFHAIEGCEITQDVKTGILQDPAQCLDWFPTNLVGEKFQCDGSEVTVTRDMADVVQQIHDGPGGLIATNKFPGLAWGVPMTTLANITIAHDGTRSPNAFRIAAGWLRSVVLQGAPLDFSTLDANYLDSLWVSTQSEFGSIINTDDPDLSRLRDSGTKLLTWHGVDDQMIPYQNSINYRRKVEGVMGGAHAVDEYYRLFLAPGVEHCGGGVGPIPKDPLDSLIRWVEHNEPPETLEAEVVTQDGELVTRELCIWPATAQYMGIGDVKRASTWTCVGGTERPEAAEYTLETEFDYGAMQNPQHQAHDSSSETRKKEQKVGRPERAGEILGKLKDRLEGLGMGLRVE
jgi:pimeloyl-ACP methyl ester carboxylesterase